jgi:hypothetical protein
MFICPHCEKKSISTFGKLLSDKASAAQCKYCKQYSCEQFGLGDSYSEITGYVFWCSCILAFFLQSLIPIYFIVAFIILFPVYMLFKVPLVPLEIESVKKAKKKQYIIYGTVLLVIIILSFLEIHGT